MTLGVQGCQSHKYRDRLDTIFGMSDSYTGIQDIKKSLINWRFWGMVDTPNLEYRLTRAVRDRPSLDGLKHFCSGLLSTVSYSQISLLIL